MLSPTLTDSISTFPMIPMYELAVAQLLVRLLPSFPSPSDAPDSSPPYSLPTDRDKTLADTVHVCMYITSSLSCCKCNISLCLYSRPSVCVLSFLFHPFAFVSRFVCPLLPVIARNMRSLTKNFDTSRQVVCHARAKAAKWRPLIRYDTGIPFPLLS